MIVLVFALLVVCGLARWCSTASDEQLRLDDCRLTTKQGTHYDLNKLLQSGESWPVNLTTSRPTPPSTTIETILLSPCAKLPVDPSAQSCPDGTLVCLLVYNQLSFADRRLQQLIPLALDHPDPTVQVSTSDHNKQSLLVNMIGATYNHIQQTTVMRLICSAQADPPTTIYDPVKGALNITWTTPAACPSSQEPPSIGGSSHAFKNLLVFFVLLFLAYLVLGIWYNYNTYGLTGVDALPHKTFWEELPGRVVDLVHSLSRLFSSPRAAMAGGRADYTPL
ncbi:hypothetical protein VP01_3095g1 [Puccinia sorghi]|uniref:Autophagy-related protein 27 n=1 Tax=Puccinia sorghi TaxID=27349 RepID=A0A0L6UZN2_9BASI|nr:hypothetical protein VP01_3095g1 [Puccinia sorghi]